MHAPNQFDLLRERRFAPFFWTQFFGARNDNVFKNALIMFVDLRCGAPHYARRRNALVNLIGRGLHRAVRAVLGDRRPARRQVREVAPHPLGQAVRDRDHGDRPRGFWRQDLWLLFTALALLGVHSTLFGPVKYAILPQHLSKPEELVGGNGLVEMGTFVAILLGTIAGGLVVAVEPNGPLLAGALAIAIAVAGCLVSRGIPHTPAVAPDLSINWNPFSETWRNLVVAQREPRRVAVDARHLVVLVLRRHLPRAVRRRSRATSSAATSTS